MHLALCATHPIPIGFSPNECLPATGGRSSCGAFAWCLPTISTRLILTIMVPSSAGLVFGGVAFAFSVGRLNTRPSTQIARRYAPSGISANVNGRTVVMPERTFERVACPLPIRKCPGTVKPSNLMKVAVGMVQPWSTQWTVKF